MKPLLVMHSFAVLLCLLFCLPACTSAQYIVSLTGTCQQSAMQLLSSGNFFPFLNKVTHDLGNVPLCAQQADSRYCSFAMTLVCVENDGTQSVLYGNGMCTGPEPVLGLCVPSAAICPTAMLQAQVTNWSLTNEVLQPIFPLVGLAVRGVLQVQSHTVLLYLKASWMRRRTSATTLCIGCVHRDRRAVQRVPAAAGCACAAVPEDVLVDMWLLDVPEADEAERSKRRSLAAPRRRSLLFRLLVWFDCLRTCVSSSMRALARRRWQPVLDTQFFEGLRTLAMMFVLYGQFLFL